MNSTVGKENEKLTFLDKLLKEPLRLGVRERMENCKQISHNITARSKNKTKEKNQI